MRQTLKALAFLAALLPSLAAAQTQLPTLPANSVLGRLGVSAGPAQAIPLSQLGPTLITSNLAVSAPLSISGLNLQLVGAAGQLLAGSTPAFTLTPTLGVPSTSTGSLAFATSGGSGKVTVQAPVTSTNWTFKWPTTAGSNGQSLTTDGSGNTAWSAGAGTVNSGTAGQMTYYATTAAAVSGNANATISGAALTLGVAGSAAGTLKLSGATSGTTTLASPASGGGTMTFPAGSDTVATLGGAQTFSGANTFSALNQFTDVKLSSGKIYPSTDSTTALQFMKANGSTRVVAVDTTNARVGINKTPGSFDLDVNGAVNVGSTLSFATLDAASLALSTSTITGLTANNSPDQSNDFIPYYSAADGRIRKCTVGACAAAATAGVSSLNGLTGGLTAAGAGLASVGAAGATVTTTVTAASKSDQTTATSNVLAITPLHQQDHDSAAKAWVDFVGSSGSINASYNVTSVTRNSAGDYSVNFTTPFATANYACVVTTTASGTGFIPLGQPAAKAAGVFRLNTLNSVFAAADTTSAMVVCYGRQ